MNCIMYSVFSDSKYQLFAECAYFGSSVQNVKTYNVIRNMLK